MQRQTLVGYLVLCVGLVLFFSSFSMALEEWIAILVFVGSILMMMCGVILVTNMKGMRLAGLVMLVGGFLWLGLMDPRVLGTLPGYLLMGIGVLLMIFGRKRKAKK